MSKNLGLGALRLKRKLILLVLLLISLTLTMVGCQTTTVGYDGPCPPRPAFIGVPVHVQKEAPKEFVDASDANVEMAKQHIKDLEVLSGCTR